MKHPVFLTLSVAVIFVLVGLYFIERQRAVTPNGASASWETVGGYIEPTDSISEQPTQAQPLVETDNNPETLVIPVATTSATKKPANAPAKDDGVFDYNAMLAQLQHETTSNASAQADKTFEKLMGAFSFAPAIAAPAQKVKTPEQQALYIYGNEIGSRIKGFAAVNPNMAQTLTNQINHRTEPSAGVPVRNLGTRYIALGESILAIQNVPPSVESAHHTLGESYLHLGEALSRIPDATEDQAFIAAITTYNNKADSYTRAFVGMVTLFSALNVTFEETDPGSVFSFRHN